MKKLISKRDISTLSRVLKYIGKYKLLLPVSIFFALIFTALSLYIPILIGDAIDLIVAPGNVDISGILKILFFAAALIGVSALSQWCMTAINNRITFHITRDIRNDAFAKLKTLPLSYIDTTSHGDIVNRVINDTDRFSEGLLLGFTQVFTGILTIVGTLFFMLVINWQIALVVVCLTPLSIFIAKFIGKRTFTMFKARSEAEAEATSIVNEMIGNQKLLRAFGYEERASETFEKAAKRLESSTLSAIFISSLTNPTTRFVNNVVYAAVAAVGAIMAINANAAGAAVFTIGEFSVLLSYTNQYTKPFNEISGIFAEFQNALASAERVLKLIDEESEPGDAENACELNSTKGLVELQDVDFSYTEDKSLIENLNLRANPGERIAIVGPTGCGKTTVINLLMRFYDINSGRIQIDGQNIESMTRKSLRASYGMVLQDTWLMAGTIRDNIAFGKPDATDEEVIAAAKAAHAHSFIKRLKNGYNTTLGEGGEGLSQGQRQLISIARVMLTRPEMLILDEATSSIDTRTELKIQDAFSELMEGHTSFIVAHRLSTIREADKILVMRDGKIIETGKHEELLKKGGFYSELYNSQFAH
ncbi:MAG: ABC transporter ATP-binding protein [Clostridia bacterium]|nr:ABC transporter ATP-binding protein [Clostridia bacterium]